MICTDSCAWSNNGFCQDGDSGSIGNTCARGTDCTTTSVAAAIATSTVAASCTTAIPSTAVAASVASATITATVAAAAVAAAVAPIAIPAAHPTALAAAALATGAAICTTADDLHQHLPIRQ